jgi:uncharacterized protein (DUF983 family)
MTIVQHFRTHLRRLLCRHEFTEVRRMWCGLRIVCPQCGWTSLVDVREEREP